MNGYGDNYENFHPYTKLVCEHIESLLDVVISVHELDNDMATLVHVWPDSDRLIILARLLLLQDGISWKAEFNPDTRWADPDCFDKLDAILIQKCGKKRLLTQSR